jgi:hypothetical protein
MSRSIVMAAASLAALLTAPLVRADDASPTAQRYELEATLEPDEQRVRGQLRLTFRNSSEQPLPALLFHLYLNAFVDRESVFMRESRGSLRGEPFRGTGSITLENLTIDGVDALASAERELVAKDLTQLRAVLEQPLAPGESVVVESRFLVALPPLFARSGYAEPDFFAVAQWFPKLAKLEPDGHFESFPYHALGEFYADFADYSLRVRAPVGMQVAATGLLKEERRDGAHQLHRFEATRVHDVAFVAARGLQQTHEQVDGIAIRYFWPSGTQAAARAEHTRVVRRGLREFSSAFGSYPYPTLSVVLPPRQASGAAGMEYPTLFLSAGEWFALPALPSLSGAFVTAHELAHQWFQGILASNELRFPVLDEGLAQWAALDLMRTLYGAREGLLGVTFDRFEVERLLAMRPTPSTAPGYAAHEYGAGEYAASVYARAALALESIRRAHGRARFARALALYARNERFGHPTPDALERAFAEVYGADFGRRVVRPLLFEGAVSAVHIAEARTRRRGGRYFTHVRARRTGKVALPTAVAVYGLHGRELARTRWPADEGTLLTSLETREPVARVLLDPDRALLLDMNVSDQMVRFTPAASGAWLSRATALVQTLLAWVGP